MCQNLMYNVKRRPVYHDVRRILEIYGFPDIKNRRNNNSDGRYSPGNDHNDTNPWEKVVKILTE